MSSEGSGATGITISSSLSSVQIIGSFTSVVNSLIEAKEEDEVDIEVELEHELELEDEDGAVRAVASDTNSATSHRGVVNGVFIAVVTTDDCDEIH